VGDLIVKPSYQLGPRDVLTVDKINLMATPIVELALADPVNDQNFLRNGNFYSSFWKTPAGISCPVNTWTTNANYWLVRPQGAAVNFLRSSTVPDQFSLFSAEVQGAASVTTVEFGQQISGDLSATLRRQCTFSGYAYNATGLTISPILNIYTANTFNNFAAITLQTTINLQTLPNATWTLMTATIDLSSVAIVNVQNGLLLAVQLPSGAINDPSKNVLFSRLKFQIGEVATEFVDDTSLFVTAPSVDSTMLQDGSIARPTLFLNNVVPKGAYVAGSIQSGDIGVGQVEAKNLDPGISTTTTAAFACPAANANVTIALSSATGISAGLPLNIQGAGVYSTISVSGLSVTVQNTGAAGNASSGTVINSGATVTTQGNAVIGGLGYTPVNKAGDQMGAGTIFVFTNDDVVGSGAAGQAAVLVTSTTANQSNDGYMPAIAFNRPSVFGRTIGLETTGKFKTVDHTGRVGYLLDSINQVDTNSIQDKAVTLQKLSDALVNLIIPPGIVQGFAGPNCPGGWLVCDGTAYYTSQFPNLYAAIGNYYGSGGSGSGAWFMVPDLRGRSPLGYVNSSVGGITARTFGSYGGEETHVLSSGELTQHYHTLTDHQHSHGIVDNGHTHKYTNPLGSTIGVTPGGTQIYYPGGFTDTTGAYTGMNNTNNSTSNVTCDYAGSSQAHNNMAPFCVFYYIIKAS